MKFLNGHVHVLLSHGFPLHVISRCDNVSSVSFWSTKFLNSYRSRVVLLYNPNGLSLLIVALQGWRVRVFCTLDYTAIYTVICRLLVSRRNGLYGRQRIPGAYAGVNKLSRLSGMYSSNNFLFEAHACPSRLPVLAENGCKKIHKLYNSPCDWQASNAWWVSARDNASAQIVLEGQSTYKSTRNIEVRSWNHFSRGEAISITYSWFVSAALVI